jgi:hypothetical protein
MQTKRSIYKVGTFTVLRLRKEAHNLTKERDSTSRQCVLPHSRYDKLILYKNMYLQSALEIPSRCVPRVKQPECYAEFKFKCRGLEGTSIYLNLPYYFRSVVFYARDKHVLFSYINIISLKIIKIFT